MAELADALRSGRSVRKDVGVQIPPLVPLYFFQHTCDLVVGVLLFWPIYIYNMAGFRWYEWRVLVRVA